MFPVEWVLVVYYGPAAHQAIYGRQVRRGGYTKDYIQLSRKREFLDSAATMFAVTPSATTSVPLTYRWPTGTTSGAFVFNSADRPHLKWETSLGAPQVWKMTPTPSDVTPETIPGDPSHLDFDKAERELELVARRGAGQPYLMVIKLRDELRTLHLRTYLKNPSPKYAWADIALVPREIQALAAKTSQRSALAWAHVRSDGTAPRPEVNKALSQLLESSDRIAVIDSLDADTGRALATYLRYPGNGLFFEPSRNHDAWLQPAPLSPKLVPSRDVLLPEIERRFPVVLGDAAAETLEVDADAVATFSASIQSKRYAVPDSTATMKIRGAAQRAFAGAVKANYEHRCAITGITTKEFLVASHIVPWSEDQSIRLDPSNGICLSLIVDRAFEKGHLQVQDDGTISIDLERIGSDETLRNLLEPYAGQKLHVPKQKAPKPEYLRRRRALVNA